MVSVFAPLTEIAPDDLRRVTEVSYLGYVHGAMSAFKRMLPRDKGSIIQVGSALAYRFEGIGNEQLRLRRTRLIGTPSATRFRFDVEK